MQPITMQKRTFQPLAATLVTLAYSFVAYFAAKLYSVGVGIALEESRSIGGLPPLDYTYPCVLFTIATSVLIFIGTWTDAGHFAKTKEGKPIEPRDLLRFCSREGAFFLLLPLGLTLPMVPLCLLFGMNSGTLLGMLAGIVGAVMGYTYARLWLATPQKDVVYHRGTYLLKDPAELKAAFEKNAAYLERIGDPGIQIGPTPIESEASKGHIMFMGATRTGKSILMWALIGSELERFGQGGDRRAVIFDAKTDTIAKLSAIPGFRVATGKQEVQPKARGRRKKRSLSAKLRAKARPLGEMGRKPRQRPRGHQAKARIIKIYIMNPFDARCFAWRISRDVRTPGDAQTFAELLVPRNPKLSQQHWDETLRGLIEEIVLAFIAFPETRDTWTFRDVILAATDRERAIAVLSKTASGRDFIRSSLTNDEHALNVMATVAAKLRPFRKIAGLWAKAEREGRSISFDEWSKSEGAGVIVLGKSHRLRAAVETLNQVLFNRMAQALLDLPEDETRENWVFIDEARQCGKLDYLTDFMVEGAGRGVKLALCYQDDAGMDEVYGKNIAGELTGQCHTVVITKLNQQETAEHASKKFGEVEQWERKVSTSENATTTSWDLVKREAVMPSEFMRLPLPSREKGVGITAFYLTPIGAYRHYMSPEEIDSFYWAPDSSVPNLVEQEGEAQYLAEWDDEDRKRLRLPLSVAMPEQVGHDQGQEPGLTKKPKLKVVRRRKAANE
jgi:hypothetical protein